METYMNEDDISGVFTGVFIWQFADCRVTDEKLNEADKWWSTIPSRKKDRGVDVFFKTLFY